MLGDHAVEAGALEAMEPVLRDAAIARARGEVDAPGRAGQRLLQRQRGARPGAGRAGPRRRGPAGRRPRTRTASPRRASPPATPPGAGAAAAVEVEAAVAGDHDLAVHHAARGQALPQDGRELGEIAVEGLQVAALDVDVVAVLEHDGAEAVPLRLEEPALAFRQLGGQLREHGLDGRLQHQRVRRAAMRPSAEAQPASKAQPGASRSITSGAWSDGIGLPLRASRSISAATVRCASGAGDQQVVDAHAEVLVEHARAVVPPRVAPGLRVPRAVGVDEAPAAEAREGLALRRRDVGAAVARPRVPDVDVLGGDVEVAAEDQRLGRLRRLLQPRREPLEPRELGRVERSSPRRGRWARRGTPPGRRRRRRRSSAPRPAARRPRRRRSCAGASGSPKLVTTSAMPQRLAMATPFHRPSPWCATS